LTSRAQPKLPTFAHVATGVLMTVHDLPPLNVRWSYGLKATMLAAVDAGAITEEDLCARYKISAEEYRTWRSRYAAYGPRGLRSPDRVKTHQHQQGASNDR